MFPHERALTAFGLGPTMFEFRRSLKGGKLMRVYRLAMCLAVIGLTMSLGYSTSQAQALPSLACAVGLNIHPGARILLNHHTIAQCTGAAGCKCVSCYNFNGSVSALCFPLITPIPGGPAGH